MEPRGKDSLFLCLQNVRLETVPGSRIQDFRLSQSAILSLVWHPTSRSPPGAAVALAIPGTTCDIATATGRDRGRKVSSRSSPSYTESSRPAWAMGYSVSK